MPRPIDSLELFYAHALAIEREAVERYDEFRSYFQDRGEEPLAGLCENIAREERAHYNKLVRASRGMSLPPIDATRYRWLNGVSPEAPARQLFYRAATPQQLLEIALQGELGARRFFRWVTRTSRDPGVRAAARDLSRDEAEHARQVMAALQYRDPAGDWEKTVAAECGPGVAAPD